jgi:type II secretory pathway component PulK
MRDERGVALIVVLLVLALLAVVVTESAYSARLEASMVRSYRDGVAAQHLAEAGVHQAIREILSQAQVTAVDGEGALVFYRSLPGQTTPARVPALPRTRVALGPGEFSYRISDEAARLGLNGADTTRFDRLLLALDVDRQQRDIIMDSLQDWRDANDLHRAHGAESEFYLKLPVPYRARNANVQDATELLQIRGVTPELYFGAGGRPGLGDLVTAVTANTVNLNTASPLVLKAFGLSDAEIGDVVQTRVRAPYATVPGRFAGRGFTVGSGTFRIEAEGLVAGVPRRRIVAVVRRGRPDRVLDLTVVSWRPGPAS